MKRKNKVGSDLIMLLFLIVIITSVIFFVDTYTPRGYLEWFLYLPIIFYISLKLPKHYITIFGFIIISLTVVGYFLSPPGITIKVAIVNRIAGVLILWMTATLLYNQNKERETVEEIKQQFKIVLDKISAGVAYFGIDGEILMANKKFADILGCTSYELLNKNILEFTHPDYVTEFLQTKEKIILGLLETDFLITKLIKKNKQVVWANVSLNIVEDFSYNSKCFIVFIHDVKEMREEESIIDLLKNKEILLKNKDILLKGVKELTY